METKSREGGGGHQARGLGNHQISRTMGDIEPIYSRGENATAVLVEAEVGVRGLTDFEQPTPSAEFVPDVLLPSGERLRARHGAIF